MTNKRVFDFLISSLALVVFAPLLMVSALLVFLWDFRNPLYMAPRVGLGGRMFAMFKIRSMVVNADRNKVDSTSVNDPRITPIGRLLRACKVDEVSQLLNVLRGDMSLVGPRPNVKRETDIYSVEESRLLSVKPGITDFSSIIFSDLGKIISSAEDPNIAYNQLVRPWKSRLGLFYIDNMSLRLDVFLIIVTALSIINRKRALLLLSKKLLELKAPEELVRVSRRDSPLTPTPPPGFDHVICEREVA